MIIKSLQKFWIEITKDRKGFHTVELVQVSIVFKIKIRQ